ncbi:unnamed protein product [Acanthoscelides obtectus]|uniref:Uncharacterized protein n=1 Tax=Acanthoscelides obtectus TaxID=200917 RepID=A0A9P0P7N4_ACAOB|nr:unnamed protein product [Acanthoscelides obtectus]CAK1662574.1 hypothetical protein AOBTE_LOCUS23218 [Acanthoscelides obtectus]
MLIKNAKGVVGGRNTKGIVRCLYSIISAVSKTPI